MSDAVEISADDDMQDLSLGSPEAQQPPAAEPTPAQEEPVTSSEQQSIITDAQKVTVGQPETRGGTFSAFSTYSVTCDGVTVWRRFSAFLWLRCHLLDQFSGAVFVPPMPPKKAVGRFDEQFLARRRTQLQLFINRVVAEPAFYETEAVRQFLQLAEDDFCGTWADDFDARTKLGDDQRAYRLQNLFPDALVADFPNANAHFALLNELMGSAEKLLGRLHTSCCALTLETNEVARQATSFASHMHLADKLEGFYSQKFNVKRCSVHRPLHTWAQRFQQEASSFESSLEAHVHLELQDVRAVLDMMNAREKICARLDKLNVKKQEWLDKSGQELKPQDQEKRDADLKKQRDAADLVDVVTKVILLSEVDKVWRHKIQHFRTILMEFSHGGTKQSDLVAGAFRDLENDSAL